MEGESAGGEEARGGGLLKKLGGGRGGIKREGLQSGTILAKRGSPSQLKENFAFLKIRNPNTGGKTDGAEKIRNRLESSSERES